MMEVRDLLNKSSGGAALRKDCAQWYSFTKMYQELSIFVMHFPYCCCSIKNA